MLGCCIYWPSLHSSFFSHSVFTSCTCMDEIYRGPADTISLNMIALAYICTDIYMWALPDHGKTGCVMRLCIFFLLSLFFILFAWTVVWTENFDCQGKSRKNRNAVSSLVGELQLLCTFRYRDAELINEINC